MRTLIAAGEIAQLPLGGHLGRHAVERHRLDDQPEDALVQRLREQELRETPFGFDPGRRHQKQNRLAAVGRGLEGLLPALARDQPAAGIDIEENVVETLLGQPIAQRERRRIIGARMADEQPCHDAKFLRPRRRKARIGSRCLLSKRSRIGARVPSYISRPSSRPFSAAASPVLPNRQRRPAAAGEDVMSVL